MISQRPSVGISKSSPNILRTSSRKSKRRTKVSLPCKDRPFRNFKMSLLPNPDKAGAIRNPYLIFDKGTNLTPKAMLDPSFPSKSEKGYVGAPGTKPLAMGRTGMRDSESSPSIHSFSSKYSIIRRTSVAASTFSAGLSSIGGISWASMGMSVTICSEEEEKEVEIRSDERAPSMFRLREDPPPRKAELQTEFVINLEESETMVMLEIPSKSSFIESDADMATSDISLNKTDQKSKTVTHTATQTTRVFLKHRRLQAPRNTRANAASFATSWDIFDTYEEEWRESIKSLLLREEGKVDLIEETKEEERYHEREIFEYQGSKFDERFLNALMTMERLIVKMQFREKQLLFQGLMVQDPLSADVKFNYSLTHLWTFQNKQTEKRTVTSLCWSTTNTNILAVGYGKFKYTENRDGLVCIWNVKNPTEPEREYHFKDPVTFVIFSPFRSQILAVTFYSGLVILLDIISRTQLVKATNQNYPLTDPVWQAKWLPTEDLSSGHCLVTCGKNGRVFRYKKTKFFVSKKIMSLGRPHGNIQGVEQPRKCYARKTLSSRHPSAEVLIQHPTDPLLYLVGSSEGCVYLCSVNHRQDHLDVFVAHNGPVYNIQYNPWCDKVFLTSGGDWCIRIWAEGITEPLATLESGMAAVQDALWSTLHSTVIISITGTFIEVWDIRRKTASPKSSTLSPSKAMNTVLAFSENKFNICVGDTHGNVHVLALSEMPFSPGFQDEVLAEAILNSLISRPDLQDRLYRIGHPFATEDSSYKSKLYRKLQKLHTVV